MVMTVSWRKGVNLWSFARCQHRGVLAEDFERTRVILRGDDEGLLAHVGPDPQCGFNRFRKRARCDRFSGARETARHNMSDAKLRSYATRSGATPRSPISISATPVSPILWRLAPELKFLMRPQLHWALQEESELTPTDRSCTGESVLQEIEVFVQRPAIETSDERIGEPIARGGRIQDVFQVGLRPTFDVSIKW